MYLLDTNILSELVKKQPNPHLLQHLQSNPSQSLFTSCICVMELRFSSALREDFESFWQNIETEIISRVKILPLGYDEVLKAGDILADLQKTGKTISIEDVLIASTALIHKFVMVTADTRHFSRINRLVIENWIVSH
jgi:predicted nucleic acid-binding protein